MSARVGASVRVAAECRPGKEDTERGKAMQCELRSEEERGARLGGHVPLLGGPKHHLAWSVSRQVSRADQRGRIQRVSLPLLPWLHKHHGPPAKAQQRGPRAEVGSQLGKRPYGSAGSNHDGLVGARPGGPGAAAERGQRRDAVGKEPGSKVPLRAIRVLGGGEVLAGFP